MLPMNVSVAFPASNAAHGTSFKAMSVQFFSLGFSIATLDARLEAQLQPLWLVRSMSASSESAGRGFVNSKVLGSNKRRLEAGTVDS